MGVTSAVGLLLSELFCLCIWFRLCPCIKRHGILYVLPEVMWYEPLYNTYILNILFLSIFWRYTQLNDHPSAEKQLMYSAAPDDWATDHLWWSASPICREAVDVFYSPSRLGHRTLVVRVSLLCRETVDVFYSSSRLVKRFSESSKPCVIW